MKLAQLQELFYARVTDRSSEAGEMLAAYAVGSEGAPSAERLEIYADMYLWRLLEALREEFPKLAGLLGDDAFSNLGTAYVRAHPSEHYDIGHFGRLLPAFLRAHPKLGMRADAADLAELDWARAMAFQEASRPPIDRAAFQDLSGEVAANMRLELVPSLRVLRLRHDVVTVFRQLDDGVRADAPLAMATAIVVWRPVYEVFHARLDPCEADALELAKQGATLAEVCTTFVAQNQPVQAAYAALASWVDEGLIAARG
jgi:hypothetical protein